VIFENGHFKNVQNQKVGSIPGQKKVSLLGDAVKTNLL
jgi:hypothetical protein